MIFLPFWNLKGGKIFHQATPSHLHPDGVHMCWTAVLHSEVSVDIRGQVFSVKKEVVADDIER